MSQLGTAGLGIRLIARELGLAPSGLYRYYANLDNIISALILDAFNALSDAVEAASASCPRDHYVERMTAVLMTYRGWALAHPTDFQLIYGNPIPGYQAPTDITLSAARRGLRAVVSILDDALRAGRLQPPPAVQHLPDSLATYLSGVAEHEGYTGPVTVLALAALGWARIHGFVLLELYNSIQLLVGDAEALYRLEVAAMIEQMGLQNEEQS